MSALELLVGELHEDDESLLLAVISGSVAERLVRTCVLLHRAQRLGFHLLACLLHGSTLCHGIGFSCLKVEGHKGAVAVVGVALSVSGLIIMQKLVAFELNGQLCAVCEAYYAH